MSVGVAPRVLRESAGRVRLSLPSWQSRSSASVEAAFRVVPGVRRARANAATGNVLVEFDESSTSAQALVACAGEVLKSSQPAGHLHGAGDADTSRDRGGEPLQWGLSDREIADLLGSDRVLRDRVGALGRARIAVRGLERDGDLARRLVSRLGSRPGVRRVNVSRLTGRVLIEFDDHQIDLEDLISLVARMELPELPGDDLPAHPMDPAPLIQSATRVTGAALGLGLLMVRRLAGAQGPPTRSSGPVAVAATIGVLEGLPPLRRGLFQVLGRDRAQVTLGVVHVVSLTFSGSPLGLAVSGASALRLLTEVRARRAGWLSYEQRLSDAAEALPGETVRIEAGERSPLAGQVIEGAGTMIGRDGFPRAVGPGDIVGGGARLFGGPFVVGLHADERFEPLERPAPEPKTRLDQYLVGLSPVSLGYAVLTAVLTRSPSRALTALLLVNARPALIGADAADSAAYARMLRCGVTVVGSRHGRSVRFPGALLIDGPRVLTDRRLEVATVISLRRGTDEAEVLSIAGGMAAASGSPWGPLFPMSGRASAEEAVFEHGVVRALVGRSRLRLEPLKTSESVPGIADRGLRGHQGLVLRVDGGDYEPLGVVALRPRVGAAVPHLLEICRERGIAVELLAEDHSEAVELLAERMQLTVYEGDAVQRVRARQKAGELVAVLSDSPHAAAAFAAADVAIALTSGTSGRFAARADLLAPDLDAVAEIVQAAARRRAAVDDAVALSVLSNFVGAVWGLRSEVGIARGSQATYVAALAAIALSSVRLAGGQASRSAARRLADPDPERWGRPTLPDLLRQLDTRPSGLRAEEAERRLVARPEIAQTNPVWAVVGDQLRSPLNGVLALGAGVSLALGAVADVGLIAAVIVANAAIAVWQEHQASRATELLSRAASGRVTVRRSGEPVRLRAGELVVGDVIVLGSGDRVPADARLLESESLEVDEASLTGESLPVSKAAEDPSDAGRVVLEGSDVTVGTAVAVVVAVGEQTRMGATAAALAQIEPARGVLDARLNRLVLQSLPVVLGGAGLIALSGLVWRRPLGAQLALAASIAAAAVPEGLPLLAGVGEAGVARRLAGRNALVRRLAVIEALGRVDIACTDKTGTLTAGRLKLTAVESFSESDGRAPSQRERRSVLLVAALASPHPDAPDVGAHPTDLAVIAGAQQHGLTQQIRATREVEIPFEPARAYHATVAGGRLLVKGAPEALVERCRSRREGDADVGLTYTGRRELLEQAETLARRGLRVLLVAERPAPRNHAKAQEAAEDPRNLVALGLVGISDPLRESVPAAVERCAQAGVRVIMLTGDHPATARAVAEQAGLSVSEHSVLTGTEISALDDAELDARLRDASVVARITPLDKLRIVERLQSAGHTVAMTGDGVNDAPALRLADVGVAMGQHGTEVARQASDVVLADDDFATLVETLVEGRSFWRNLRRSLGLLLGGNLGELGMIVGASVLGLPTPLNTRQILAVNLVTDVLPALAVAAQQPEHRDLAMLRREGDRDIDSLLRADVLRRGWATAAPAIAAYTLATRIGTPAQARSVAFGAIVATQLGQTLGLGRSEGTLTRPVLGAIIGSGGFALAAMSVPPLRAFFGLALPPLPGLALITLATAASMALATPRHGPARPTLPPDLHPLRALPASAS